MITITVWIDKDDYDNPSNWIGLNDPEDRLRIAKKFHSHIWPQFDVARAEDISIVWQPFEAKDALNMPQLMLVVEISPDVKTNRNITLESVALNLADALIHCQDLPTGFNDFRVRVRRSAEEAVDTFQRTPEPYRDSPNKLVSSVRGGRVL
ncbi:hypothetical protein HYZ78_04165 [Candidatus Microgenomates bacterium]|nr:hypothetical protein [Candidatus Microgenomates bacterium]